MAARLLGHEGGLFRRIHEERIGGRVDLSDLRLDGHPPARVELARRVWQSRVQTELRSVQIMTRFLSEVVGAGDPLEVYAAALDLVEDEVRHTELCALLCEALGAPVLLPDPVELRDPERFLRAPMPERALTTAIQMLAVNETISVAFIEDLRDRCEDPAVSRVLEATVADEEGHEALGWSYVEKSLGRFPEETLAQWRHLVELTLKPHRATSDRILAEVPRDRQRLDAFPEPELAALGLFSPERQALVFRHCFEEHLRPRLARLSLI